MPDWTKSMQQTYDFYEVDPHTWTNKSQIKTITGASIEWDLESSTLTSASFDATENFGEIYIRTYLTTVQNGITEHFPLGTHLVQTPSVEFNGKYNSISYDAYSPLTELTEKSPIIGYYIPKDEQVSEYTYNIIKNETRLKIDKQKILSVTKGKLTQPFVANNDDTWMTYITDLLKSANLRLNIDSLGDITIVPIISEPTTASVWTYTDDNSSILTPEITMDNDMYGLPNVVDLWYNGIHVVSENHRSASPLSIENRGRKIIHRLVNPTIIPTDESQEGSISYSTLKNYADNLLKQLSSIECTISYTHGYCPVKVGDTITMNYKRAGITNVKALVKTQSITCSTGCQVSETAAFQKSLWG